MARGSERGIVLQRAAATVAYQQGLAKLTLANVAEEAKMPLGSLYYYYKTREDVVASVVEGLERQMREWTDGFERLSDPAAELKAFARQVVGNAGQLARYGCPIGTLTAQLRKESSEAGQRTGAILASMAAWAESRFSMLGLNAEQARREGRMMLVKLEGAAMMVHATGDQSIVSDTVSDIDANINSLTTGIARKEIL